MKTVMRIIEGLPRNVRERISIVGLGYMVGDCRAYSIRHSIFSGSLVRADVALRACCRFDFFLDQVDSISTLELGGWAYPHYT